VVLRESSISYYEKNGAKEKPKGSIPMTLVEYCAPNPAMKANGFTVFAGDDPDMCYEFCATGGKEDLQDWVSAFERVLESRGKDKRRTSATGTAAHYFGDKVTIYDFAIKNRIGEGGTAQVYKVLRDGKSYAMKVIEKGVLDPDVLASTQAEQSIMDKIKSMNHPNIVGLHYAFENEDKLHLVLDYCVSDMFDVIARNRHFSDARAQLYAAQIASALDEMHQLGFVHCDLKLENLLITEEGHPMVCDFGFTQRILPTGPDDKQLKGHTLCYTPPEVLAGERPSPTTDFWALGNLIYEFHHGLPPFYDADAGRMSRKIVKGEFVPSPRTSPVCLDLLHHLLHLDPDKRVGGAHGMTFNDLKAHDYFNGINWAAVRSGDVHVPI